MIKSNSLYSSKSGGIGGVGRAIALTIVGGQSLFLAAILLKLDSTAVPVAAECVLLLAVAEQVVFLVVRDRHVGFPVLEVNLILRK
ncbi:hypothetical protein QUA41_09880 [Microcoleus sp. Pol11C1]